MRVHREAQPLADRHGCLGAPSSDNRWFTGRSRNRRSSVNFLGRVNVTQSRGARFAILCLPMTNAEQDALRVARPRVAVLIDKIASRQSCRFRARADDGATHRPYQIAVASRKSLIRLAAGKSLPH